MNETLKGILCEMGLPYSSSDEAAQAFFDALTDDLKSQVQARLDAVAAAATAEAENANAVAAGSAAMSAKIKVPAETLTAALAAASKIKPAKKEGDATSTEVAALAVQNDEAALAAEGKRVAMLRQLGTTLNVDEKVVQLAIANGDNLNKARVAYLKHLQDTCKPVTDVRVGDDQKVAMLSAAMPEAVAMKLGCKRFYKTDRLGRVLRDDADKPIQQKAHEKSADFASLRFHEMVRHYLVALGAPAEELSWLGPAGLVDLISMRALRRKYPQVAQLAQSTSDFDNILLDAQNKTMRMAYVEALRTWNIWAKRNTNPDFKNINRIQSSEVPNLTSRVEGHGIDYVTLGDSKETYTLSEYTAGVRLTRRVLVNDTLNSFGEIVTKMGQAAARLEDTVAYAVLTGNSAMADTGLIFNTTAVTTTGGHANLVSATASIGAPTVTTVAGTEKLMLLQKGPKNAAILDISPKFWVGPVALKTVAQQFFKSPIDPAKSNNTPNPYNGVITPIANPRLDANSSTIWYLLADYRDGQIDTVEVCFLEDEPEPVLKQETDFDTDDQKYAVRHVVAAKALDFRGMVYNPGANSPVRFLNAQNL
jgi:hypothetical protein